MADCRKNGGYTCHHPADCSRKGCKVDRDYNGVDDMEEIHSGRKPWRKLPPEPDSAPATPSSSGPGVMAWIGLAVLALLIFG